MIKKFVQNNINMSAFSRALKLVVSDTLIMLVVWFVIDLMSGMEISSLNIHNYLHLQQFITLYLCVFAVRFIFQSYSMLLRYSGNEAYLKLIVSDSISAILFFLIGRFVWKEVYIGFSYTLVTFMMINLSTIASRLIYQCVYAQWKKIGGKSGFKAFSNKNTIVEEISNVAIVGAGNEGALLAQNLMRNPQSRYCPTMFIDIDPKKIGAYIHGIKIYKEDENVANIIRNKQIKDIIIAMPDALPEEQVRLYDMYKEFGCNVKIYDYEGLDSREKAFGKKDAVRDFTIEDLLFRKSLENTISESKTFYIGKTVLVTGGGGSIGSELCRQIAKLKPAKLIILDIYENNIYDIQQELIRKYGAELNLEVVIASVRDTNRLEEVFEEHKPQIVFHAAAHKHVPLMEHSGCEAIKNNVFGTYNVANMSEKYGVEKFLLISTDKAVNPTNVMGASKRLCEMVIQCRKDSKTQFTAVRFGNVLGSNGSVIPLFKKQIEEGGPITITDKRIVRYFMTIPEAVALVMEACAMANSGELYVLDMGNPVKILDLAENMIKLSGHKPYEDIDIIEVGLRPGEKLYEELLMKTEELDKTKNNKIYIERDKCLTREQVDDKLDILLKAIEKSDNEDDKIEGHYKNIINALKNVVPTYRSPEEVNRIAETAEEMRISKVL